MLLFYTSPPGKRRNPIAMSDKPKKKITWKQWQRQNHAHHPGRGGRLCGPVLRRLPPAPASDGDGLHGGHRRPPPPAPSPSIPRTTWKGSSLPSPVRRTWPTSGRPCETQVRLLRGRSVPAPPVGGYYYEVSLSSADGGSTYSFGCDSSGELLILGGGYAHPRGERPAPRPGRPCLPTGQRNNPPTAPPRRAPPAGRRFPLAPGQKKIGEKPRKNVQKVH